MGPAPARKLGGGSAFALRARGEIDRFQRGLRTHIPLPLRVVGTPKSQLCAYEAELAEKENWVEVQHGVEARLVAHPDGREQERCGGPWRCG
jgi:hypothetical protein